MKSLKQIISWTLGVIILGLVVPYNLNAQSKARVENVDFFPDGSSVIITYDILKAKANETFRVWINVHTESGQKIIPNALTGDVGSSVIGGPYKRIIWDMKADQAFLNEDIAIVVMAESELVKTEKQAEQTTTSGNKQGISVGGALGLSLVLPGLGRRIATGKGAAYLWGVAAYGCLGGAYFLNNSAYNNYEDYKSATTPDERDDLYKKAKNQDLYSKVLIGAAAVIWVTDLIVTGVKASKIRKSSASQKLSLTGSYDPQTQQPLIGLKYRF